MKIFSRVVFEVNEVTKVIYILSSNSYFSYWKGNSKVKALWSNETLDEYKSLEYFVRKSFSFTKKGSHGKTLHSLLRFSCTTEWNFFWGCIPIFFPQKFFEALKHTTFGFMNVLCIGLLQVHYRDYVLKGVNYQIWRIR